VHTENAVQLMPEMGTDPRVYYILAHGGR